MEGHGSSLVLKARIAFHSAAAKAERVIMDFKSDRDSDTQLNDLETQHGDETVRHENESKLLNELKRIKWRPPHLGIKQDWQDKINNIRKGRKEVGVIDKVGDINMATIPFYDENLCIVNVKNDLDAKTSESISSVEAVTAATDHSIPPSFILKQLAIAVEAGRNTNSMKDFVASSAVSSPTRDRAGLSLSAVKALVLREKDRLTSEFSSNEKVMYLINSLFDPEGGFLRRKIKSGLEETSISSFPRDIHGAPPQSLTVKLAEAVGSFKTLREMALFWCRVVAELRKLWSEEKHLPGVPQDDIPDLKSCLLYQQFQVINCCISRKSRHILATESLDSMLMEANSNTSESANYTDKTPACPLLYARLNTGELVLRLGADCPSGDQMLLETGEPAYSPFMQEGPLLTEDLIKETEEFVLRTGSVGAGCSQLLSDMQAFKAANPGCILEDFVRWYSPPDWTENEESTEDSNFFNGGESLSTKGQLSLRMQKEGNLWREFWETSKPVPAVKQAPLFDEDLAVEGILDAFEDIQPSVLFGQLFVSLLGLGFAIAEPMLSGNVDFSRLFNDWKEYIVATCQSNRFNEKVDELVQIYEMVETMMLNPKEALKMMKHTEESTMITAEPKHRFQKLSHIFGGKDKLLRPDRNDEVNDEEKSIQQSISSFFDSKSSLFSKKPTKPVNLFPAGKSPSIESDWTVIYETVDTMVLSPKEALKMTKHTEESTMITGEPKHRFQKLSHIFGGKDKLLRPVWKDEVNDEEKPIRQSFSSFFDSKSSLFSKKPINLHPAEKRCYDRVPKIYETVETILLNPKEALKMTKHTEESTMITDEPKHRFQRLSHIFGGKEKLLRPVWKDEVNYEEKPIRQSFSSFFDSKSSLFSKKPINLYPAGKPPSIESDWTVV
ncbi:hypothetical protein VNO77_43042 [Canavalia gladiata]|uniref:Rab3GAP catalytic subunit conserved domain-containing protein n=1 Tax=Canavalia gladiata TaxID=3824 RepID=A0AAN9JU38_CANGL